MRIAVDEAYHREANPWTHRLRIGGNGAWIMPEHEREPPAFDRSTHARMEAAQRSDGSAHAREGY